MGPVSARFSLSERQTLARSTFLSRIATRFRHNACDTQPLLSEPPFVIPSVNTILFSTHEDDLRAGMEHLKNQTLLDEYFVYGYGAHHLWVCQRRASDKSKIFEHRILIARF